MEPNELPDELAGIRHMKTYSVPANYFDELADDIISKIHLPVTAGLPFSAPPATYFNTLPDYILLKIKNENKLSLGEVQKELEETEPLLARIPKTNVYRVPPGYFDSFTVSVPTKKEETPVIKMRRPASWIRYAAAAVVTGIIAVSAVFLIREKDNSNNYTQELAKVSDNEISDYLDNTLPEVDIIPASQEENKVSNAEGLFKILLNNVSDSEIQDYLKANDNGDEKDIKGI